MTDWSSLYANHAADVFRFALHLCGSRAEAEDLTSETFVRAWTSPEPIRASTVKGYLFTIARNLYLQGLRREKRRAEMPEDVADPARDPSAVAEHASQANAVMEHVRALPELDRAALLMKAIEGMPYDDVARALGISAGAARVRVHRARREILRKLEGE